MSHLLDQSVKRMSDEHMKDKVALEVWSAVVGFINTGKLNYTLVCWNASKYPRIEKATSARIHGWCKLVALKPEWTMSCAMEDITYTTRGRIGARNWVNHWDLILRRTTPPSNDQKLKLIAEYGRPPGY